MRTLNDIVGLELMKPGALTVVVRRLQIEDMPTTEKEALLREWATRARRALPEWAIASLKLPAEGLL